LSFGNEKQSPTTQKKKTQKKKPLKGEKKQTKSKNKSKNKSKTQRDAWLKGKKKGLHYFGVKEHFQTKTKKES
jgi:hypothetical protein